MKYIKKIIGERIYLSPMNEEDAEKYVEWVNDFAVSDGLGDSCKITTLESEIEWIRKNIGEYQFAIVKLEDDQLIGNCSIHSIKQSSRCAELGMLIGEEKYRSEGYGSEALQLIINYAYDYLNLNNLMAKVYSFNNRSINCLKRAGFKEFGRRREASYVKGEYHDVIYMDMIRNDRIISK